MEDLFLNIKTLDSFGLGKPIVSQGLDSYCINDEMYKGKKKEKKIHAVEYVYKTWLKNAESSKEKEYKGVVEFKGAYYLSGMNFQDEQDVEIFAKALFQLFFERGYSVGQNNNIENKVDPEKLKKSPLCIAVDFEGNKDYAREFIRIFAIFYDKTNENEYMAGVQVAVCSTNEKTGLKAVNFVLAGQSLDSAYATANNFVYYNADASLEFIPLLAYFKRSSGNKIEPEPLYPFELYLMGEDEQERKRSWFELEMNHRLSTDLRKEEYGCKIPDVRVRIGSKIRIDTFYEAELLLHNVGTIKRFAYLIAQDIAKELESEKEKKLGTEEEKKFIDKLRDRQAYLFLLGYENYSAVLMQEVQQLLKVYFKVDEENSNQGKKDSNEEENPLKIEWMIDTRSEDFPVLSFDKYSKTEQQKIAGTNDDDICCITILPVASTMSTVYKLHDSFERGLKRIREENKPSKKTTNAVTQEGKQKQTQEENQTSGKKIFLKNYCLLAVGNAFLVNWSKSELETEKKRKLAKEYLIIQKYLSKIVRSDSEASGVFGHTATLQSQTSKRKNGETKEDDEISVKYLLSAPSTWYDPYSQDEMTGEGGKTQTNEEKEGVSSSTQESSPVFGKSPLLKVDKTSTLLDAHFQTPLSDKVLKYYNRESNVEMLKPDKGKSFVKYGHILRGDNHFQFFFDTEKLAEARRTKEEGDREKWVSIEEWAEDRNKDIEPEAFNIVISPLQMTNAPFLKIILNKTFGSNLHLLHINLLGTGKESVRNNFEYIANEFSQIVRQGRKINFYYVDDIVCTGSGLARAWKFLLTLCNQSEVKPEILFPEGQKFTKVFLLINRSAYETANAWVKDPNEDWLSYINLCVPSYNTHMEKNVATCPGCRVHARYDNLRKKSTTNELFRYFDKHAQKHLARNPRDYELWLDDRILNSPAYFEWLRVWMWFQAIITVEDNEDFSKYCNNFDSINELNIKDSEKGELKKCITIYHFVKWADGSLKSLDFEKGWYTQTIKQFIDWLEERPINENTRAEIKELIDEDLDEDLDVKRFILIYFFGKHVEKITNGDSFEETWNNRTVQKFIDWVVEQKVDDVKQEIKRNTVKKIKEIIAEDNYLRLKTMDKAYRVLLYNNIEKGKKAEKTETLRDIYKEARNKGDFKNYSAALRYKIVELLASCFNQKNQYSNVFEFISYIKVISRDYLAKNYFIREAMYDVLKYLFDVMITPRGELNSLNCPKWFDEGKHQKLLSKIRNNNDENPVIEATLQYRIFKVITHRLAMMRYENMFQSKTIMKIVASCEAMFNGEKEINIGQENKGKKISVKEIFLALPPREEMITSYLASVKTATMEENDDAVCLTLWQQTEALAPNIEIAPEEEN